MAGCMYIGLDFQETERGFREGKCVGEGGGWG